MASRVRIALDSSYLIALLCDWHAQHQRTLRSYLHWQARHAQIVLPVHALLESYSVLTRMPAPYRLPPEIAARAIQENFGRTALIAEVPAGGVWERIGELAESGVGGGQVYDALIVWCAIDSDVSVLLTWNRKHFTSIAPPRLEVREP